MPHVDTNAATDEIWAEHWIDKQLEKSMQRMAPGTDVFKIRRYARQAYVGGRNEGIGEALKKPVFSAAEIAAGSRALQDADLSDLYLGAAHDKTLTAAVTAIVKAIFPLAKIEGEK